MQHEQKSIFENQLTTHRILSKDWEVANNSGIQTKNDRLTIKDNLQEIKNVISVFQNTERNQIAEKLNIRDSAGWKVENAYLDIKQNTGKFVKIDYRLFDTKHTYFTGKSSGFLGRTRGVVMESMIQGNNIGLIFKRTGKIYGSSYDFISVSKNVVSEGLFAIDPLGREYLAPLYIYSKNFDKEERTPNLNEKIVAEIGKSLGLKFVTEKEQNEKTFSPIDILDYIYAVLHSPTYREKYKEFLKIDFPRVPYPKDKTTFWKLVALGKRIREIHLLESPTVEKYITQYPESGDNVVKKIKFVPDHKPKKQEKQPSFFTSDGSGYHDGSDDTSFPQPHLKSNEDMQLHEPEEIYHTTPKLSSGKVYINDTQYFANVPETAWNFYIGGYQPAQKWLKDRKDRTLEFDDILHYQKIIVALSETDKLMKEIDKLEIE